MSLKENRNLLSRMLMIAQVRQLDLKDVMTYPLSIYPPTFSNFDGSMKKTNKAILVKLLETKVPDAVVDIDSSGVTAVIIDAMALIQQTYSNLPATFTEYADEIFKKIIGIGLKHKASRLDFVVDRYKPTSIKSLERTRRATGGSFQEIRISRGDQKLPRQFKKFLSVGKNKESLVQFLFDEWQKYPPHCFHGIILYVTHGVYCHKLQSSCNGLDVVEIHELENDHEEADTRMFLHAYHASHIDNVESIIIRSPDTDVVILALNCVDNICAKLYQHIPGRNSRFLNITKMAEKIGKVEVKALLGLHIFSGCDSVSCFTGKGKKTMVNSMLSSDVHVAAFSEVGVSWNVTNELLKKLEAFVCKLYGQKQCTDINEARYNCFRLGQYSDVTLPPNRDSLRLHILRANYQTAIHRKFLDQHICEPNPGDHGWVISDGCLSIKWSTLPIAPDAVMQYAHCKCKKSGCITSKCSMQKEQHNLHRAL